MKQKRKFENVFFDGMMGCKKEIETIKELRRQRALLEEEGINSDEMEPGCPLCGNRWNEKTAICEQCGYVSEDRNQLLNKIEEEKKSLDFQISTRTDEVKKLILILSVMIFPVVLTVLGLIITSF